MSDHAQKPAHEMHHVPGTMDIRDHEKTYAGFLKITTITVVVILVVLVVMALANS